MRWNGKVKFPITIKEWKSLFDKKNMRIFISSVSLAGSEHCWRRHFVLVLESECKAPLLCQTLGCFSSPAASLSYTAVNRRRRRGKLRKNDSKTSAAACCCCLPFYPFYYCQFYESFRIIVVLRNNNTKNRKTQNTVVIVVVVINGERNERDENFTKSNAIYREFT